MRKTGTMLEAEYPELGASADAIDEDCVFEIKCPSTNENIKNYIDSE